MYIHSGVMARRSFYGVRLDPESLLALRAIAARELVPVATQIREGIKLWIASREGPSGKAQRKRAPTRSRAKPREDGGARGRT